MSLSEDDICSRFSNEDGIREAIRKAATHFRPPPKLLPSEWSERNIYVPIGNAIPGLIRFDNAPYQREPLDMTADPSCTRITLMWGAQVGKTMLALCAQAYRIAQNPQSQIMMQPSQGDLSTWLETKFNPLIESNDTLQELVAKPRAREGVNNQRMKSYPGGFLMFSWSGSPKTMRGRSAPFIVCDEVDGYDMTGEGHPVSLLWQRAATYGDQRTLLEISTPTIKGSSWIETAYDQGDQRRFHIQCPHCEFEQHLQWSNVSWPEDEPEKAVYACSSCGAALSDSERIAAIRKGRWIGEREFKGHASYHLNELYSCFRRLGDIAQSFLEKKRAGDLQSFINVSLAETWEEGGDSVDDHSLLARREDWGEQLPDEIVLLTAGIDTQDDRLEVEIVGWGKGEESWSVDYKVIHGDPSGSRIWNELDQVLSSTYTRKDGVELTIRSSCIDSGGHHTQSVYSYAKIRDGKRIFAIKGVGGEGRPLVSRPTRTNIAKIKLFSVGVDTAKELLYSRLKIDEPGDGFCHFPAHYDEEYFKQLTGEALVTKWVRGHKVRVWKAQRRRVEALDCRVYAMAAMVILSPNLDTIAEKLSERAENPTPAKQPQPLMRQRPQGGFVNNWR